VFYAPWLSFPSTIARRSGLLFPALGTRQPRRPGRRRAAIYWNLAPNYDLLYTPRYIGQRGLNHEAQGRYLDPYNGDWNLGGSFIADDKQYAADFPEESDARTLAGQRAARRPLRRTLALADQLFPGVGHRPDPRPGDLAPGQRRNVNLLQLGQVDYLGDKWLVNLQAQQFQPLAEDIREDYKKLPQITAQYRAERRALRPQSHRHAAVLELRHDDDASSHRPASLRRGRRDLPHELVLRLPAPHGEVPPARVPPRSPARGLDDQPGRRSALASIDGGLFFERETRLAGRDVVQTLEPRVFYLYSQFDDQTANPDFDSAELTFNYNQLFRDTRFSGRDRLDDANQLALGLTTRFLDTRRARSASTPASARSSTSPTGACA
jgi:LPS-assembly protein